MRLRFYKQKKQIPSFFGMFFELLKRIFQTENQIKIIKKVRFIYLTILYKFHLKIRYLHDLVYAKNGRYKKYSDSPISNLIHKSVLTVFVISFGVFFVLQNLLPNLFSLNHPNLALAAANSKTWTTNGNFLEGTPDSNITITGSVPEDNSEIKLTAGDLGWSATSTTGAPVARGNSNAVWTGSKMIVWGGYKGSWVNTGGVYDPITNNWTATSLTGAPAGRYFFTMVWTGSKMIVWGGKGPGGEYNNGGIYDPSTNTWSAMSTTNAPIGRVRHTAVWTGSKMIVWGGDIGNNFCTDTGGIYDPSNDTWSPIASSGLLARYGHTAIWTGSKMVVWGGAGFGGNPLAYGDTGAAYDPVSNSWSQLSPVNAPVARQFHTAVWTGSKMIVWGGAGVSGILNSGGIYDPSTNAWSATSIGVNVPEGRSGHSAFWTSSKMIIWGGGYSTGGFYNPSDDTWEATPTTNAPSNNSDYAAAWAGDRLIIWGSVGTNTGSVLHPVYPTLGIVSDFRIDAGVGAKAKWGNINWNSSILPANTLIKFNARTSDDGVNWSGFGGDQVQTLTGSTSGSGTFSALSTSRYLDIKLTLVSDGSGTATLNDFTVRYDSLEAPTSNNTFLKNTDNVQLKNSAGTGYGGLAGLWTNESAMIVHGGGLSCTGCGTSDGKIIQVQYNPVNTPFSDETTNVIDGTVKTVASSEATITGLAPGNYHLRTRVKDNQGRVSAWTSYGGNTDTTATDFSVEQTAPTISSLTFSGSNVSGNFAKSNLVDLSLSASDTGGSNLSHVRFSNNGSNWSDWENYATTKPNWDITNATYGGSAGDGQKTVYVQVRDNAGNTNGNIWTTKGDFENNASTTGTSTSRSSITVSGINSGDNATIKNSYTRRGTISTGGTGTVAVKNDGTVIGNMTSNVYGQANFGSWTNITDVAFGGYHTVGLKADGTVVATGYNSQGQTNVSGWTNIKKIASSQNTTIGLKTDGTVVGTGDNTYGALNFGSWTDIFSIDVQYNKTVGLKSDGTVVATGENNYGSLNISGWTGIIDIAVSSDTTIGVKSDGTILMVGNYLNNNLNSAFTWTNIEKVSASQTGILVGLKNDGTAVVLGRDQSSNLLNYTWSGIKNVDGNYFYIVGQTSTDSIVTQGAPGGLTGIKDPFVYSSPSTISGLKIDAGAGNKYKWDAAKWISNSLPAGTSTVFNARTSDDNSNWSSWTGDITQSTLNSIFGGGDISTLNSSRYLEVRFALNSDTVHLATINDFNVTYSKYTTITLDTAPPTAFTLSGPANNIWQNSATPTFTWNQTTDANFAKYQLYINDGGVDVLAKDNITQIGTTTTVPDVLIANQGMHVWYVKAIDASGNFTNSNILNIGFDNAAPNAISGFSASQNDPVNINLSWSAYSDGSSPATNYQIQRVKRSEYDASNLTPTGDWSGSISLTTITCAITTTLSEDSTGVISPLGCSLIGQNTSTSYSYVYRVRAKDTANPSLWGTWPTNYALGMNADIQSPSDPSVVTVTPAASGYANQITWNISSDTGSGVSRYLIWRRAETNSTIPVSKITGADITNSENQIWTLIGVLDVSGGGAIDPEWTDNDENNDLTVLDKTLASPRLNDYVQYFYRVTAIDTVGNRSEIIPADSFGIPLNTNFDDNTTPDVTPPVPSATVSATPMGLDGENEEPNNQQMDISWSTAIDARTLGRIPEGNGSGTVTYKIYRAIGDSFGPTEAFVEIATRTVEQGLKYSDKNLAQDTFYYYKILAIDFSGNPLNNQTDFLSETNSPARTKNSQVPTTPTEVQVQAVKGSPAINENVGKQIVFSFTGSAIKFAANKITGYEIYRSTTNFPDDVSWLSADKVYTFDNLDIPGYESNIAYDIRRQFTDSGLTNSTSYYYRVRAIGLNSTSGIVESGLSAVSVGILNSGWDTTPDTTAPMLPTELKVKDIHDDGVSFKRNIITWKRILDPSRNGVNDFKEYRLYRSNDGLTWSQVCRSSLLPNCTTDNPNPLYSNNQNLALATNYYIDLIPNASADQYYFYYVTAIDNAGTNYRYSGVAGTPLINANFSNESPPLRDESGKIVAVSLNPALTQPSINTLLNGKKANLDAVGVSSATIYWETDQACDSLIEYRKTGTEDKFIAAGDTEMKTTHTVTLRALDPLTTYEYRLLSRNYLANTVTAEGNQLPGLTTVGFTITPGSIETTTSTAKIAWTTNLDADSNFVEYQLQKQPGDQDFSSIAGDPELSKNHEVIIKGLRSGRTYTYKIRSISLDKYVAETAFLTFRTRNFDQEQFTLTPSSTNVAERNITATTALIAWQTSIPTTSWVDYSVTSGIYDMSAGNNDLNTQHAIQLEGLVPGTKYFYRVRVKDANEVEFISQEYSFVAVLKPKIENFRIDEIKPYKVSISWTSNVETETLVNWGKTAGYGEKRGKSEMSKSHILNIDGLEDNTEYHFQILAHDAVGNEVADSDKTIRTPMDTEGPKIQSVKTDILPMGSSDETASVIISWTTDKPATTMVEYDEGIISGKYSQRSIEDTSLNSSHTVIIKDLKPAASYHFKLISKDKRNNVGQSQDYTFVTPTKEKSILQLILKSLEETFAWTRNMNQFFGGVSKRIRGK